MSSRPCKKRKTENQSESSGKSTPIPGADLLDDPDVPQTRRTKRGKLPKIQRELPQMMYGYGDSSEPLPESISLVGEIVENYIIKMTEKTERVARVQGRTQIDLNSFLFLLRRDVAKMERVRELIWLNSEIKKARRKQLEDVAAPNK
eukprot:g5985.t1